MRHNPALGIMAGRARLFAVLTRVVEDATSKLPDTIE
jgi:hypothetical protein